MLRKTRFSEEVVEVKPKEADQNKHRAYSAKAPTHRNPGSVWNLLETLHEPKRGRSLLTAPSAKHMLPF